MINLHEFINRLKTIFQLDDLKPESIIKFGPTKISDLKNFRINKCVISIDFNYNVISSALEEKANLLLLYHTWSSNNITDEFYKKLRYLKDKKICIIKFPKEWFSVSYGIYERIGSIIGLEMVSLFNYQNAKSARIFEPLHHNFDFQHLLDLIYEKFNINYVPYVGQDNNPVKRILIYIEKPISNDIIIECYRQDIDTIICSNLNFFTARCAEDYNIKICNIPFNCLNIILQQFITHDLEMEIPEVKYFFVPSTQPIKFFTHS